MLILVLFLVGVVLIVKSGDLFVDAATWMAEAFGVPKFIVGATVVSLATTLPELLVSLLAAGSGRVDMAVGNAVGSVTANLGLIMAIALLCMPSKIRRRDYIFKVTLMLVAAGYLWFACRDGELSLGRSVVLLVICGLSLWDNLRAVGAREGERSGHQGLLGQVCLFLAGCGGILIGAQLLVDNGSALAILLGVPERIVAVTVIAIGTSLPELVTTLTAIRKGQAALSAGNIIGANILDLTLILPLCAVVSGGGLPVSPQCVALDLPATFIVGCVALVPTMITGKFQRWQGVLLLLCYGVYLMMTCGAI